MSVHAVLEAIEKEGVALFVDCRAADKYEHQGYILACTSQANDDMLVKIG